MTAKLAFISAHGSTYSIRLLCTVLGVARSWFHDWRAGNHAAAASSSAEADLVSQIRGIFQDSGERYRAPRIHAELRSQGIRIARKRVARLMRENRIRPPRRKKRPPITTDSRHDYGIAPNLLQRAFEAERPNAIWLADITYVATDEGWLYLAAVKDIATREIVGWSMADHLKSSLCENALRMAIQHHAPPAGLIHHSDRGVQYACGSYRRILDRHEIRASMSRKGDCLDNAPMESFFGSLKTELVYRTRFRTRQEAKAALFEYIEIFYNRRRRHSGIGYRTPAQAHAEMLIKAAA
jgi:transposase InsO family protein